MAGRGFGNEVGGGCIPASLSG
ncbi:hypothetical protein BAL199_04854 [alpha proteobacterium BAL199]|nr:hypothetical protein BAL199_04854 [alpha proteobacterium BAL199]